MKNISILSILCLFFVFCNDNSSKKEQKTNKNTTSEKKSIVKEEKKEVKQEEITLNTDNAIPFLYEYEKNNPENKVRIITDLGNIDIELYKETPYHRANFIFLAKQGYFDGTCFYRIVYNSRRKF